jgi:hypothetical protein
MRSATEWLEGAPSERAVLFFLPLIRRFEHSSQSAVRELVSC